VLAQSQRLPNQRTVKRLYSKGRRLSAVTVFVHVAASHARTARSAVVCGKKVNAKAVVRNRLKRVARSVVEGMFSRLLAGHDFLITLRPAAAGHEAELRRDLSQLLAPYVRQASHGV